MRDVPVQVSESESETGRSERPACGSFRRTKKSLLCVCPDFHVVLTDLRVRIKLGSARATRVYHVAVAL